MSRKAASLAALLTVAVTVALPSGVARAACGPGGEPSPDARAANDRGLELGRQNDFAGALAEFQRAYDECPSFVILYNIGKMARLTQDFARSLRAYQRYLSEGGAEIEGERRTEVEREIASLSALVGYVSVEAPQGAKVTVDGVELGIAPIAERVALNPGAHRFEATLGANKAGQDTAVKAGDSSAIQLAFTSKVAGPKVDDGAGYTFPSELVTLSWITASTFTWAAVITGSVAVATSDDLADDTYLGPDRAPAEGSSIAGKSERIRTLATVTDVLVVAAAVTGAAAITFSIVDAAGDSDPEDEPEKPAKKVVLGVGPGTIVVRGSF